MSKEKPFRKTRTFAQDHFTKKSGLAQDFCTNCIHTVYGYGVDTKGWTLVTILS